MELIIAIVFIVAMIGLIIWISIQMRNDDKDTRSFVIAQVIEYYTLMKTLEDTKQIVDNMLNTINEGDKK